MLKKTTPAKKATIENAIVGWHEVQANPKNCQTEFTSIPEILNSIKNNQDISIDSWEDLLKDKTILFKKVTDDFHNTWSVSIDISRRNKTVIRLVVVGDYGWREVVCSGKYNSYEISTTCSIK